MLARNLQQQQQQHWLHHARHPHLERCLVDAAKDAAAANADRHACTRNHQRSAVHQGAAGADTQGVRYTCLRTHTSSLLVALAPARR